MKYTPEELIRQVRRQDMAEELIAAIGYNQKDFHLYRTKGSLKVKDGEMVYDFGVGGELEPLSLKDYCSPDQIDTLISHPESIRSGLIFHAGDIAFVFTFSPDKDDAGREEEFWDHVFLQLFTMLGIDTMGRLRKFMEQPQLPDNGITVFRPTAPLPGK